MSKRSTFTAKGKNWTSCFAVCSHQIKISTPPAKKKFQLLENWVIYELSLVCNVCQLTIFFLLHFNFIPWLWTSSPAAHILGRMTKFLTLSASQRLMLPSWTAKLSHGCRVKIKSSLLTSQPVQPVILVQREQWSPFITKNNNKNIPSRILPIVESKQNKL